MCNLCGTRGRGRISLAFSMTKHWIFSPDSFHFLRRGWSFFTIVSCHNYILAQTRQLGLGRLPLEDFVVRLEPKKSLNSFFTVIFDFFEIFSNAFPPHVPRPKGGPKGMGRGTEGDRLGMGLSTPIPHRFSPLPELCIEFYACFYYWSTRKRGPFIFFFLLQDDCRLMNPNLFLRHFLSLVAHSLIGGFVSHCDVFVVFLFTVLCHSSICSEYQLDLPSQTWKTF